MVLWYWAMAAFIMGIFVGAILMLVVLDKEGEKREQRKVR